MKIFWIAVLALIALLSKAAQPFTPLLVVDSVNTLVTRVPVTGESIVVLGQAAAYDSAPRIARNFPAGSYTVDGVDNFAAVNGTIWHLNWLSSGVNINGTTAGGIVNGTNVLWLTTGTNAQAYITGYQTTNAALNALIAGGDSTNFFAGDLTYKQVTTNMIPSLNTHVSNLQTAIGQKQTTNAALNTLIAGSGAGLTNVARSGLGQPEVSGVTFDGATSSTKVQGLSQSLGTNDFSIWVRSKVPTSNTGMDLIGLTDSATSIDHSGSISVDYDGAGGLSVALSATPGNYRVRKYAGVVSSYGGTVADYVLTRTGTNIAFYINGIAQTQNGSDTVAGSQPLFDTALISTYLRIGSGTESTLIMNQPVYRAAVFNRALSAADVQSLVKNGIDPSDQWGNSTVPVVSFSPSTLNGGFETNSLNAAGTWATSVAGASTASIDTTGTNSHSGSNAMKLTFDPTNNIANIYVNNIGNVLTAGKKHRASFWIKQSASSTNVAALFRLSTGDGAQLTTTATTTNWAQKSIEWTALTSTWVAIVRDSGNENGTFFVDDVELTRIGAVLDLDFTTGGGTNVFDRSSNSLTATNYGGVSWTLPLKGQYIAGNSTIASNLTVAGTITGTVAGYQTTNTQLTTLINNSGANLTNVAMRGLGQPEVSGVAFDGTTGTRTLGLAQALGTNTYSVWARVQVPSATSSSSRCIFGLSTNAASAALSTGGTICYIASDDALYFQQYGATTSDSRYKYITGFRTNYSGQIVDLVVVNSKSDVAIYLNGVTASTSEGSAGTRPPWTDATASAYFRVGSTADSGGGAGVWTTPIYRTAVFNRALSQSDVTSLINNGIDPADQWGTQTDIVGPATLNGGFETAGAGGADIWGTWVEFTGASSTLTNATGAQALYGSNSLYMARTNSADATGVQQSLTLQPNRRYRISAWAKSAANGTQLYIAHVQNTSPALAYVGLTTNWAYYSNEGVTTSGAAGNFQIIPASGQVGSIWVDNVQLTPIGAILDLDFTTGYGTNVWDRSSNSLNATNYGGVSWTMPVVALNTGTIQATNLTATYISGNGSAITSTGATNQNQLVTLAQLESFTANGLHMFFYGSSNAAGINSGAASHTNWAYSTASSAAAVTNTVASPTNSQYLCEFVSNDTFTQFASGVVNIEMWMFFNSGGGRAVSVLAEAYIYDSVGGTNYVELTPATAAQDLSGTLTKYLYSIPIPDITPPNASRLVVKFKVGSVASTPTVSMVSQGVYTSHAAFSVPLSSYVLKTGDTMTGALTLPSLTSTNFIDLKEGSSAGNPATNYARLLIVPSGAKQALIIKWSDGTTNTIATHP